MIEGSFKSIIEGEVNPDELDEEKWNVLNREVDVGPPDEETPIDLPNLPGNLHFPFDLCEFDRLALRWRLQAWEQYAGKDLTEIRAAEETYTEQLRSVRRQIKIDAYLSGAEKKVEQGVRKWWRYSRNLLETRKAKQAIAQKGPEARPLPPERDMIQEELENNGATRDILRVLYLLLVQLEIAFEDVSDLYRTVGAYRDTGRSATSKALHEACGEVALMKELDECPGAPKEWAEWLSSRDLLQIDVTRESVT